MLEYSIKANLINRQAFAKANQTEIYFDASVGRDKLLPNPAELLLTSLAACMLKNIVKFTTKLRISYKTVKIQVNALRSENPPTMEKINYLIKIDTAATQQRINLLHRNILKHGTIINTLEKSCALSGQIIISNE